MTSQPEFEWVKTLGFVYTMYTTCWPKEIWRLCLPKLYKVMVTRYLFVLCGSRQAINLHLKELDQVVMFILCAFNLNLNYTSPLIKPRVTTQASAL